MEATAPVSTKTSPRRCAFSGSMRAKPITPSSAMPRRRNTWKIWPPSLSANAWNVSDEALILSYGEKHIKLIGQHPLVSYEGAHEDARGISTQSLNHSITQSPDNENDENGPRLTPWHKSRDAG